MRAHAAPQLTRETLAINDSLDVSLHSKINNWIALLFLIVVFNVLSSLLSKLVAMFPWLQGLQVGAASLALLSGAIGVATALFASFVLGNLMAEVIPMRPPLSSILMSGKHPEIARGDRIVLTVALVIAAPVVQVAGLVAESYLHLGSSSAAPAKVEQGRLLFAPSSDVKPDAVPEKVTPSHVRQPVPRRATAPPQTPSSARDRLCASGFAQACQ